MVHSEGRVGVSSRHIRWPKDNVPTSGAGHSLWYNVTPRVGTGFKETILALKVLRQLLSRILWHMQNMEESASSTLLDDRYRLLLPNHPLKILHVFLLVTCAPDIQPIFSSQVLLHSALLQWRDNITALDHLH